MAATSSEQPEDLKNEDNSGSDVIVIEAQDKTEVTETDAVDGKQPLRKKSRRFGLDRLNPKRRSKSREDLTFETAIDNMVRTILKRSRSQEEAPILPEQSQARTSEVVRSQEHPQAQRRVSLSCLWNQKRTPTRVSIIAESAYRCQCIHLGKCVSTEQT